MTGPEAGILFVRSGCEEATALALDDLEQRFHGVPLTLLTDPGISQAVVSSHSKVELIEYTNLREFLSSQFARLRKPKYLAKVILLTGEPGVHPAKFKCLFLLFRAQKAIVYNDVGQGSEVNLQKWRKKLSLPVFIILVAFQDYIIRLLLLPVASLRLAYTLAVIFGRKRFLTTAHGSAGGRLNSSGHK